MKRGIRLSIWIGPTVSAITLYVTLREVFDSLFGRLVLP